MSCGGCGHRYNPLGARPRMVSRPRGNTRPATNKIATPLPQPVNSVAVPINEAPLPPPTEPAESTTKSE